MTSGGVPESFDEAPYVALFEYLDRRFGINFSLYRINSVSRRLQRRMDLLGIPDIPAYREYLESNKLEAESLYQDLLIGVTEFFRDEDSFKTLASEGIKAMMLSSQAKDFRIWVAGCATGQEAYSIYILADEIRKQVNFSGRITLFATDVFKPSIERAGKGVFNAQQLSGLSEARRQHYFQQIDKDLYKINSFVRENIIFAHHNFLVDPPFTNMDLVCCRNVLIYLKPLGQESALSSFAYALQERGLLFLGGSESLGELSSSFKTVSSQSKIFRKQSSALDSKRWPQARLSTSRKGSDVSRPSLSASVTVSRQLLGAYDTLLERYAPCGFLVNAQREVLHYFGNASDYCVHVTGRVSSDITEQLDKHLKLAVTALIHRCVQKNEAVCSKGIRSQSRRGPRLVDVSVEPMDDANQEVAVYLVEIAERKQKVEPEADVETASEQLYPESVQASEQIKFLEKELSVTRENLEAANEELQVSNEELQAINEEMQVSNEELQSTNEELHSLNEELRTLNAEYERKNDELISLNISHENLLESTEDGVLYVDKDRRIQKFNSAIHSAFKLMQNDIGRPLDHIAYRMEDAVPLLEDVRSVLETGERVERDSVEIDGRFYSKRIVPYRGADGQIDGALLTFTDVSERLRLERRFAFALESAKLSWWEWDLKSGALNVHTSGRCLLGEGCLDDPRDREGWMSMVHPNDREQVEFSLEACLRGETEAWDCEHRFRTTDGEWLWVQNQGVAMRRTKEGKPLVMIGMTRDINERKLALLDATSQRDMLEAAGEIAHLGYWDYDPMTNVVRWSSQVRAILGVGDDFDPSVEGFYQFVSPSDLDELQAAFKSAVEEGKPPLPIVVLTADAFESVRRECLSNGANELLVKPVSADAIGTSLAKYLSSP